MDFAQFTAKRAELQQTAGLQDFAETRLARVVSSTPGLASAVDVKPIGYRCHVAEAWLARLGWPAEWKPRALVSRGVRHSLECLFGADALGTRHWALPADVYPVYLDLARRAGVDTWTYSSIGEELGRPGAIPGDRDVILLAEPCKPRGSHMTLAELQAVLAWLEAAGHRRVVLDTVYDMALAPSPATQALLETGQCLVLHSLAKAWARPWVAGLALVPAVDVGRLTPAFRSLEVDREGLALAEALLRQDLDGPRKQQRWLADRAGEAMAAWSLAGIWPTGGAGAPAVAGQYLFLVRRPWGALLEDGVLALPGPIYGASEEVSVLSALPALKA